MEAVAVEAASVVVDGDRVVESEGIWSEKEVVANTTVPTVTATKLTMMKKVADDDLTTDESSSSRLRAAV